MTHYLVRFTLLYIAFNAGYAALSYGLETFAPAALAWLNDNGGGTGIAIAFLMMPAIFVGQHFVRREGRGFRRLEGWGYALAFLAIAALVSAVVLAAILAYYGASPSDALAEARRALGFEPGVVIAVGAVMVLLTYRLGLWSGARGALKQAERAAR